MAFGLGVARGMLTTISHLVKPPVTIQYPEERLEMPIWTRGRPRLIYEVDSGELRCTACGACALACPVDVIKIEQHPSPIKGKVLDRFDIDMAGLHRVRAVCRGVSVSGRSPWRRTSRWPRRSSAAPTWCSTCTTCGSRGPPRSTRGWSTSRASNVGSRARRRRRRGRPAARAHRRPPRARRHGPRPRHRGGCGARGSGGPGRHVADYDPLTIGDADLKNLPPAERALVYHARLKASGWTPPDRPSNDRARN